jgi:hypothetical protein
MAGPQAIPEGLTVEQALEMISNIQGQVQQVDLVLGEINERYFAEWTPWTERRTKLMAAWTAVYELLPYLPSLASSAAASIGAEPPAEMITAKPKNERITPRSVMLDLLRASTGPVSAWDLAAVVQRAGLQTKMAGAELVYQTLYAAKKAGHPIERNEDGSWHWKRDNAA